MKYRWLQGSLFATAALTAALFLQQQAVLGKPLPDYGAVPAFVLMDQTGEPFSFKKLESHPWVAGFIFTRCAGQCPMMVEYMKEVAKAANTLPMVAFSVDPEFDTAAVLSDYAQRLELNPSRWHLLTDLPSKAASETACPSAQGCLTSTRRLSVEGFHLSAAEGGSAAEPVTHSVRLILIDHKQRIRGYYDATDGKALGKLKHDAQKLMKES